MTNTTYWLTNGFSTNVDNSWHFPVIVILSGYFHFLLFTQWLKFQSERRLFFPISFVLLSTFDSVHFFAVTFYFCASQGLYDIDLMHVYSSLFIIYTVKNDGT